MLKKGWQNITILLVWIALLLGAIFTMPNVSELVKEKGQVTLPSNLQSELAQEYAHDFGKGEDGKQIIAVFNSDKKLTKHDKQMIAKKLAKVDKNKADYQIKKITQASDSKEVAKQVNSKDQTTQLALFSVKKSVKADKLAAKLRNDLKIKGLHVYTTGSQVLAEEFSNTTQKGLKKTELISVIFIFIVLVCVFRSPIIPLISLATVGISYIVSSNLVMNFAKYLDFPISNFTQIFMVVVLFGIGTDYNILLYDRFKEELANGLDAQEATFNAHKKAGRTILYSGSTVLIGFTVLVLAKFSFYRSAVGVALGVAILLLNLLTFNSFFMRTLGAKIFWPNHNFNKHESENKFWATLSKWASAKPLLTIIFMGILTLGIVLLGRNSLNYDNSVEIPATNPAKIGYKVIQDHYDKGMTATTTVYLKTSKKLTTSEKLAAIDELTQYLKQEPGVQKVSSVTQPTGTKIKQLYLHEQLAKLTAGLTTAQTGINQISGSLNSANNSLQAANVSQQVERVQTLADGTNKITSSSQQLASGTSEYTQAVGKVNSNLTQISQATEQLNAKLGQVSQASSQLASQVNQVKAGLGQMGPQMQANGQLVALYEKLNTNVSQLAGALTALNDQNQKLTTALGQVSTASQALNASGQKLSTSTGQLAGGMSQVNTGVQTLNGQVKQIGSQTAKLTAGLNQVQTANQKINDGLAEIKTYLNELGDSYIGKKFYLPKESLDKGVLDQSYQVYVSNNKELTKISIVLDTDPNDLKAVRKIRTIEADTRAYLKGSSLKDVQVAFGGQTSKTSDLEKLANEDLTRTAIIMLIGIGIAVLFITRSLTQTLTIMASLIIAYLASLQVTRLLSDLILGKDYLTWNTPFFAFILLVAIGVDYSIFLITRYHDNLLAGFDPIAGINEATGIIGSVVLSAAVILGGTFAALIPSGVTTLIQVAFAMIVGLIFLVIILPITIPATIKLGNQPLVAKNGGQK